MSFFIIFVFANNVWARITIRPGSLWDWLPESTDQSAEPLRPGKSEEFKATAFRTNPHDFQLSPGIEKDPEIGYIKFSATGGAKKSLFSDLALSQKSLNHNNHSSDNFLTKKARLSHRAFVNKFLLIADC